MNNFNRTELKFILEGLAEVRERMRQDVNIDLHAEEYNTLLKLQDRVKDALESRFY